jgi:hypothetical protein
MATTFRGRGDLLRELMAIFVQAPPEDSDEALNRLYRQGIEPRASSIIRHKLRVSLRHDDDSYLNQIGLDLLSDVKAALLPVLRRLVEREESGSIDNFDAYVRTAVMNAYHQYLRDKHPLRLSLRNKIRYILSHRPGLTIWKDELGALLCGRAVVGGEPAARSDLVPEGFTAAGDENAKLLAVIHEICQNTARPIRFEDLVSSVWEYMRFVEHENVDDTDAVLETLVSSQKDIRQRLDEVEHLRQLWSSILAMEAKYRRALLLNLTDGRGDNLIVLFPSLGITSIRQIADALEFPLEEFAELWLKLPLDDRAIAELLGVTRQQVINLRQTARAKLRRATS